MQQVVLVGQPAAVLPRPLVDVVRVLRAATGEDRGAAVRLRDPRPRGRSGRVACRGTVASKYLVTDAVPVISGSNGGGRIGADCVAVELERSFVVNGERGYLPANDQRRDDP